MTRSLTTIRRQERGSVMVITAAMMMVLLGMLALSMDMGYVLSGRTQLQNGIDAAARAAASGLHVAIEPGAGYSHQDNEIIKPLAKKYAGLNSVGRYKALPVPDAKEGEPKFKEDPNNGILLDDGDIQIQHDLQPPRVTIRHRLDQDPPPEGLSQTDYDTKRRRGKMPTIFAGIFSIKEIGVNLDAIGLGAAAIGTVVPVEGGTGMLSGGWRPLLLPDTYFDISGEVWAYMSEPPVPAAGTYYRVPKQADGDYYRSRFAGGTYGISPFIDGSGVGVTSIRDAKFSSDLRANGGHNLLAQPITIKRGDWRVADFNTTYPGTVGAGVTPGIQIDSGYGGYVKVGDSVTVYLTIDSAYDSVATKLRDHLANYLADTFDQTALTTYGYVKSNLYQTPNIHPQILPVLLCSPIDLATNPDKTQYQVTNFGAFFLQAVSANGDLTGYFVREVVVGGLTLQSSVTDHKLLPVAVRMLK